MSGKIQGCVLKNHFYPTAPLIPKDSGQLDLFAGLVLNRFVGGLNPDAVYASALIAKKPLFVWFPTMHSEKFLLESAFEIPPEWTGIPDFKSRRSDTIEPISVTRENIRPVLAAIKDMDSVLCTGHLSWQEAVTVTEEAMRIGISKIIITHPIYQRIDMPISIQKDLAVAGCFIEHCYSMFSIDGISFEKMAEQIREVGINNIILSSDVGQMKSVSPDIALEDFGLNLMHLGFSVLDVEQMVVKNPKRILNI
jgi:hypothetical protein